MSWLDSQLCEQVRLSRIKSRKEYIMSVAKEIREEQKKALSTMSTKEKFAYFWEYYKIHTFAVIIVIAIVISFVRQLVTQKDTAFYAMLIDAVTTDSNYGLAETWNEEFLEYAQIDPDEYEIVIDTSVTLSESINIQYTVANQQRLMAMLMAGSISTFVADTETFETYAQSDYFFDMKSLLSAEELEKYGPYLYYTDAATFDDSSDISSDEKNVQNDRGNLVINHRDPSTMEQPVAVGIILTEDNKIAEAGYYAYLKEAGYEYQGYPSDVVLGIPLTNKEPDLVIRFLEYIFE